MLPGSSGSSATGRAVELPEGRSGHAAAQLIASLLASAQRALPPSALEAEQYIVRACQLLLPSGEVPAPTCTRPGPSPLDPWRIGPVAQWIDTHLGESIRIEQLAALVHLSHSHFSRSFHRTVGESPASYIRRRRIERAQQLMLTTRLSLAQIALECGLADQCHLTRVFRSVAGITPANWRRQQRTGRSSAG
jgi:transcriptional regulator GlxA family with amidase domain